jgi:hypothetical protein
MNKSNFTTTLSVDQTPKKVFDAIKNISGWWSAGINGSTDKLNDEFIYHYKDIHYSKMKLIVGMSLSDPVLVWVFTIDFDI